MVLLGSIKLGKSILATTAGWGKKSFSLPSPKEKRRVVTVYEKEL